MVLIAGIKLSGSDFQHVIQLGEKAVDALLLVLNVHALDGQTHNVDGRERQVAATDGGLFAKSVLKHAGAASHRGHLMLVAFGIVGAPLLVVVVGGVQIDEIGEETPCRYLAGELIEVIVGVTGLVAHAGLLFPDLNGENGRGTVAHATISRFKQLADDATSLGTGVGAIVDGAEHDLVATARVDGVHVVDKCLHRLVHTTHRPVDGMVHDAVVTLQEIQFALDIVVDSHVIEAAVVLPHERLQVLHLLDIGTAYVGGQVEVKSGYRLTAVHLVLGGLHRDAGDDTGRLDALGGARLAVASHVALLEHLVQRVLHAGETLGGIIVLVVDMQVIAAHGFTCFLAQQVVVDEGLGGLAGKLHHHAGRRVGIHVGILAGNVVILGIDDFQEQVARFGFAGNATFLTIVDIAAGHLLAGALHQFQLHLVLNVLDTHLGTATMANAVSNALDERFVLACLGGEHRLADCSLDFFLIVANDAAITFKNSLDHILFIKK